MRTRSTPLAAGLLAVLMLCSIASPALSALLDHHPVEEFADCHGAPCPDGDGDRVPCDDGCGCLCCPGHAKACFSAATVELDRPVPVLARRAPAEAPHPSGVSRRVFHPPRA